MRAPPGGPAPGSPDPEEEVMAQADPAILIAVLMLLSGLLLRGGP